MKSYLEMTRMELTAERDRITTALNRTDDATEVRMLEDDLEAVNAYAVRAEKMENYEAAYAASGFDPATPDDAAKELRSLDKWARAAKVGDSIELRTLQVGGTTAQGADTVPTVVGPTIIPQVYTAGLENLVRVVRTSNGQPIDHPKRSAFQALAPVSELATYGTSNGAFATVNTSPVKLGALSFVSAELLDDSAVNVSEVITGGFQDAYRQSAEAAIVAGTYVNGSGILGETAVSTTAAPAAVTGDELIAHFYATPKVTRDRAVWLFNSNTIEAARKLKDSDGNYLLAGLTEGTPRLMGRPVLVCESMPDIAAGEKFGALVDPSAVLLHVVRGLAVERSDLFKWDEDVVSYKGAVRMDCAVADSQGVAVLQAAAS